MLTPDRLFDFFFYVKLASPGYFGFGVYEIINLLSQLTVCASSWGVEGGGGGGGGGGGVPPSPPLGSATGMGADILIGI